MTHILVRRLHQSSDEPVLLISELSGARMKLAKWKSSGAGESVLAGLALSVGRACSGSLQSRPRRDCRVGGVCAAGSKS